MDKNRKKRIRRYLSWCALAALVVLLAVMPLLAAEESTEDGPKASILSGTVQTRSIETRLIGGGQLASANAQSLTIPAQVKLKEYLVGNGDTVKKGDAIALVDRVSAMSAIAQVQEALEELAEEITSASTETASTQVTAQAGGTVKRIYAQTGDDVQDVMLEHGALAVLNLDGLMAVQIARSTSLRPGDVVCVQLSDDTEVDGKVESNRDGILTVTIEDKGYAMDEMVRVATEDGDRIGSGPLYLHSRWNAVAYSGTVSYISVSEGDTVYSGRTLMRLEDTGKTAQYQKLVAQHQEYEDLLGELFTLYHSQTVTAPCDGIVTGVDENGAFLLSDTGEGWTLTLLGDTESQPPEESQPEPITYQGYVALVSAEGLDGLILKVNPTILTLTDLNDLSGVPLDTQAMTEEQIYEGDRTIYTVAEGEWTATGTAAQGDILLFLVDSNGYSWILKVGAAEQPEPELPEEPEASEPTQPTQPEQPGQGELPEGTDTPQQQIPTGGVGGMGGMGGMAGIGGMFGGMQEEEESLYSLETISIASVTSQERMTLEITIDEQDITKVYVGQEAMVTVDALEGETFRAVVSSIANTGENAGGSSKFAVELTLDKSGDMLPGMNAAVVLTLSVQENVPAVPVAALGEENGETVLYTAYDEKNQTLTSPVIVSTGVSDGEYVQILEGIAEGTTFYYSYYDTLEESRTPESGMSFR